MEDRKELYKIRILLLCGEITYDDAFILAKPYIDNINRIGDKIAKRYGKRFTKTTFSEQMR